LSQAYQTIKRVYLEARALSGAEREALLARECGVDRTLRAEVEELLAQEDTLGDFMARPVSAELAPEPPAAPLSQPERIGAYRILKPLGFGGMGVVYLAEQDSPRRQVALKLLRLDTASATQVGRFEQEAELLGRLAHPGIARVYEAGWTLTETGRRPFFAMEFVEGRPLTEYAAERALDLSARLKLLSQVAEAVHYAHGRGIVHRDLKPSNVFVDARGEPRVLDFGVARPLGEGSRATKTGQLVGTLAYMSPEQASGRFEITPRGDVYSLGVILYELLTGRLPIATDHVPLHEAVRRVREEEPIPAGAVKKELRGELETILGKTLAKEPERRYASAAELAEDLRFFLEHRPIRARRPTSWYVAWKLVRRHRLLAATVATLFAVLSLAQFVVVQNLRNQREKEAKEIGGTFWREAADRERIRHEVVRLHVEGDRLKAEVEAEDPPTWSTLQRIEEWLPQAEIHARRLEEYRAVRAGAPAWIERAEGVGAVSPSEREYALIMLDETVEALDDLCGPRGSLALLRNELQRSRAAAENGGQR
jgi:serine/threonine protein kinase